MLREHFRWILAAITLVIIAAIHAVTTRYVPIPNTNRVLDRWTGVSYSAKW